MLFALCLLYSIRASQNRVIYKGESHLLLFFLNFLPVNEIRKIADDFARRVVAYSDCQIYIVIQCAVFEKFCVTF